MSEPETVGVSLTRSEALVLFEWISKHGDAVAVDDESERRVLWRIVAQLESVLTEPLERDYDAKLDDARRAVRGAG